MVVSSRLFDFKFSYIALDRLIILPHFLIMKFVKISESFAILIPSLIATWFVKDNPHAA